MTRRTKRAAAAAIALTLSACSTSPPVAFYTLAPIDVPAAEAAAAPARPWIVGVGPVTLPGYVDRPDIVVRTSPYTVELAQFNQWAEPVLERFNVVLAQDLAAQLPNDRVIVFPPSISTPVDLNIAITVTQFDADLSGRAALVGEWRAQQGKASPTWGRFRTTAAAPEPSMQGKVAAMSQTIADLATELAAVVATARLAPAASAP